MVDFLASLFGGSQQSSTPTDMTPDAFKSLQGPFAQYLSTMLSQGGGPKYQGPLQANMGANEGDLLGQLMGQTNPGNARGQLLDKTMSGGFLPGQPGANPFLDAAIRAAQQPTMQGLTETLTRDLPGRFTAAGQFIQPQGSSAFDRAAAIATRGAADASANIATNMSSQAYESERGRQQQAIPLSQQEVQSTISNLQAQALPRMIQENGIDRGISLFKDQTQQLMQILGILAGVTQPTIASQSQGDSAKGIIPGLTGLFSPSKAASAVAGG